MAKTKDISTLESISANSATVLGKSSTGEIGFISGLLTESGTIAGIPDHSNLATKEELQSYVKTETLNSEVAKLAPKNEYVKINITEQGNTAYMNNEWNGGLMKLTTSDHIMSKVTLYNGTDAAKTYVQLIVKDEGESSSKGIARINGTLSGFYYTKTIENTNKPENEIATLSDVNKRTMQELPGTSSNDVSKIQNQTDGGVMQYVKADGGNNAVCVNNDTQNVGVELCSLANGGQGSRIILNNNAAYYTVTNSTTVSDENKIATIADVNQRTMHVLAGTEEGDVSKIQNQNDGGVMQYVKKDGANNAVCVNNGTGEQGIGVELCALNKDHTGARLILNDHGAYLTVTSDTTFTDENMLVTKKDIADLQKTIKSLQTENKKLQKSLEEATKTVNTYTENVSQLLKQS